MDNGRRKGRTFREVGWNTIWEPERVPSGDGAGEDRSSELVVSCHTSTHTYINAKPCANSNTAGISYEHTHSYPYTDPDCGA